MDELAILQGTWAQVAFEIDGASVPHNSYDATGILLTVEGNRFSVHATQGATPLLEGTFVLIPTTIPKAVDWTDSMGPDAGKTLPAIYRLEENKFTFIAADAGLPRPTEFRTTLGLTMREFVRLPEPGREVSDSIRIK